MGEATLSALAELVRPSTAFAASDHYTRRVGENMRAGENLRVDETMRADDLLIARLQAGDESAFRELVTRHDRAMRRLARSYVQTAAAADEVVQETWLAVIRGLAKFERRSSLKTWIFRILVNRAQTRGAREKRLVPFSALAPQDHEPAVDADRFLPPGHPAAGYWSTIPNRFFELPEDRLLAAESKALIAEAIAGLPDRQRQVIELRDVEGWASEEVCDCLGLSAENQRVLLHRARSRVRAILEEYFAPQAVEA